MSNKILTSRYGTDLQGTGSRRSVLVDDEIENVMMEWATNRTKPTMLFEIDPRCGLQQVRLSQLLEFSEGAG